ncbi:methylenetetrahydrofolate reductase C-terminal domain-containing protein [Nocardiopsis potens]|uniref:methylenetetrahydrofolate reductase C-terminal domain-containing protein n=1 Tax=Nocardiopsis potens TaxID=1246458 RepID=UPI0003449166|nr:methylenetetrahydrofolate reductase C-terminal domain-containing protein [Nocardiopsis potens]
MATLLATIEHAVKKPVWGCRMCGQCVLHSTGFTCPMTCPKNLRNGPCGGVREDGSCEVDPSMRCVWLKACTRADRLPGPLRTGIDEMRAPVDKRLEGTSSWANLLTGRDRAVPAGWPAGDPEGAGQAPPPEAPAAGTDPEEDELRTLGLGVEAAPDPGDPEFQETEDGAGGAAEAVR